MTEPTDLTVVRGQKKEPCLYCGGQKHETPLACPRIAHIAIEDGAVCGISFWEDFFDYEPDPAA